MTRNINCGHLPGEYLVTRGTVKTQIYGTDVSVCGVEGSKGLRRRRTDTNSSEEIKPQINKTKKFK